MSQTLGEIDVWAAFRALRVEGTVIHDVLAERLLEDSAPGATLELGGGDAHLWRRGRERLVSELLARGPLLVTDADPDLVARCRTEPSLDRAGVTIEVANAERLPHADGSFERVIGTHVLHWCETPERVSRAVREIARVLAGSGRAYVTTVEERVHMREVYELLADARDRVQATGVEITEPIPEGSPRVLPFCAGNAEAFLRAAFSGVRRIDVVYAHLVDARHETLGVPGEVFVARYLETLPFLRSALLDGRAPRALIDTARDLARERLRRGPLRWSRCDVTYVCSGPARGAALE